MSYFGVEDWSTKYHREDTKEKLDKIMKRLDEIENKLDSYFNMKSNKCKCDGNCKKVPIEDELWIQS